MFIACLKNTHAIYYTATIYKCEINILKFTEVILPKAIK